MSKKHFIALADAIRAHNRRASLDGMFGEEHIAALAEFCKHENPRFMSARWTEYIAGKCGPSGGSRKRKAS